MVGSITQQFGELLGESPLVCDRQNWFFRTSVDYVVCILVQLALMTNVCVYIWVLSQSLPHL